MPHYRFRFGIPVRVMRRAGDCKTFPACPHDQFPWPSSAHADPGASQPFRSLPCSRTSLQLDCSEPDLPGWRGSRILQPRGQLAVVRPVWLCYGRTIRLQPADQRSLTVSAPQYWFRSLRARPGRACFSEGNRNEEADCAFAPAAWRSPDATCAATDIHSCSTGNWSRANLQNCSTASLTTIGERF